MKMLFLGAAHEVTGSCTYLEVGDKKGIVDYGMEQGKDLFENEPIPVPASELDFVLLTHAHIDHAGLLPLLYKQGFRGSVYTSSATVQLCDIMLRDSANIQMQEAEWQNRRAKRSGGEPVEPLYSLEDVDGIMSRMIPCPYDKIVQVNDCVSIRLTDVGHLLGSAAIEIWLHEDGQERKICFSGDIGNRDQPILRDPMFVSDAQYLVIESTYGDRLHSETRVDYVTELARRIKTETSKTIWCWTGFTLEELEGREMLKYADVLVDGPFVLEQKDAGLAFRGSRNQRIIRLVNGAPAGQEESNGTDYR